MLNFIKIIHKIDWISSKTKNLLRNAVTSIIRDTKLLENYLSYPSSSHEFPDDESQSKSRKFEQFESLNLCSLKHTCPPSEKSCLLEIVGVYLMHRRRKQLGYLWKKDMRPARYHSHIHRERPSNPYFWSSCNTEEIRLISFLEFLLL